MRRQGGARSVGHGLERWVLRWVYKEGGTEMFVVRMVWYGCAGEAVGEWDGVGGQVGKDWEVGCGLLWWVTCCVVLGGEWVA